MDLRRVSMAVVCPLSPTPTGEGPREVWALSTIIIGCTAVSSTPRPLAGAPQCGQVQSGQLVSQQCGLELCIPQLRKVLCGLTTPYQGISKRTKTTPEECGGLGLAHPACAGGLCRSPSTKAWFH